MLKRMMLKKIIIASCALFALLLIAFIPNDNYSLDYKEKLEYVSSDVLTHDIFLLDSNNYLALTSINVESLDTIKLAKEMLEILIKDGLYESKIPSGFKSIIPSNTNINSVILDNHTIIVDLSKELFDVTEEYEEKIIEAITYSLTSIKNINNVVLLVDGNPILKLPISGKILPSYLDRSYGINKKYDLYSLDNIISLTTYYINKHNEDYYYVPVTSYINDSREKISIIIEQLSNNKEYVNNLMSLMNSNTELLASNLDNNVMKLEFNDALFSDIIEKNILEEVVYTISLSVFDNYNDIKELVFIVDNEEILKKVLE